MPPNKGTEKKESCLPGSDPGSQWLRACLLHSGLSFNKSDVLQPLLITIIDIDLALKMNDSYRHVRIVLKIIQSLWKGFISLFTFSPPDQRNSKMCSPNPCLSHSACYIGFNVLQNLRHAEHARHLIILSEWKLVLILLKPNKTLSLGYPCQHLKE